MPSKRDPLGSAVRGLFGSEVLDDLVSDAPPRPAPSRPSARKAKRHRAPSPPPAAAPDGPPAESPKPPRDQPGAEAGTAPVKIPTSIPAATLARARRAAYWTPGETLAHLIARAIEAEVSRMEEERGAPFPEGGGLRRGRPLRLQD